MADAQNERTNSSGRRRGRRAQRGSTEREQPIERRASTYRPPERSPDPPADRFVRPEDIVAPTERVEVYCTRHMALVPEHEPMHIRTKMTSLRHLPVDHFGSATLFCDCLHNGPHEWPPTMQKLETAIELDQFINESNKDA